MTYERANELLTGRCSVRRKLGNNTYLERRDSNIVIRLHNTDIMIFNPNGDVTLESGGWRTVTTKARLNEYLAARVWSDRGVWYLKVGDAQYVFDDGITIHPDGTVTGAGEEDSITFLKKLKRRVFKYADDYITALFNGRVSAPGLGDCFYCQLTNQEGQSMGEVFHDKDHLESHIREKCYVPSLLMRALKRFPQSQCANHTLYEIWGGGSPPELAILRKMDPGNGWHSIARDQLTKSLRRYIVDQIGMQA
jgi:hypothetical protein